MAGSDALRVIALRKNEKYDICVSGDFVESQWGKPIWLHDMPYAANAK